MAVTLLPVRGTCPKCKHVLNETAPKGRFTWRGECPQDGCDGRVVCRRLDSPAGTKKAPQAAPEPAPKPRRKVVKVDAYVEPEKPAGRPPVTGPVGDQPGGGDPAAVRQSGGQLPGSGSGDPAPVVERVAQPKPEPRRRARPRGRSAAAYGDLFGW